MANTPFRIDILDSTGTSKTGDGPLTNIIQLNDVRTLDKIGQLNFTVPANDPKTQYITKGSQFDVYDEVDGYLGRFLFNKKSISDNDGRAIIAVQCWSMLKELVYNISGFAREYAASDVSTIVTDLIGDISGWSIEVSAALGTANVTYQGQTIYEAIEEIAKRWGYHFRLKSGTTRTLQFGAFGVLNTGVRLTNLQGQSSEFDGVTEVAIVKSLKQSVSTDEVFNRIVVVGAGNGASMLTLKNAEAGDYYTVASRTRANGQDETYIQDATSIAEYGAREAPVIFDQIRPVANTATAKTQAQTELLKNGERWLLRYKDAREQYDNVTVYGLKTDLNVGEKVELRYKEFDDFGSLYLDVDDSFWITQITRTRQATGERNANLQLVNIDKTEMNDTDIMASAVKAIRSEKLWIKPTAFRFENTYYDLMQSSVGAAGKDALFTVSIDDTVTDITRVVFRFKTHLLSSSVSKSTLQAGAAGSGGARVDNYWLAEVDSHAQYPRDVKIFINGTDYSNHVDVDYLSGGTGPWNADPANASVTVEIDVTDVILSIGIYNDFAVKFTCEPTGTAQAVTYSGTTGATSTGASHGMIEFTTKIQGVAQAIYKS